MAFFDVSHPFAVMFLPVSIIFSHHSSSSQAQILFPSFAALARDVHGGPRFLDLGSGTGRATAAWALLRGPATGVELRPELHATALQAAERLPVEARKRLRLHCGDLFDFELGGPEGCCASGSSYFVLEFSRCSLFFEVFRAL